MNLLTVSLALRVAISIASPATIHVDPTVKSTTNERYASWNIDASYNRGFFHIDFTNKNLLAAAKSLSPSTIRFGGSGNDYLVYGPPGHSCSDLDKSCADGPYPTSPPCCLNSSHWDSFYNFVKESDTDFLFGLSFNIPKACKDMAAYQWESEQAELMIKYIQSQNQTIWGFELGNEINNRYEKCSLNPKQQADSFAKLEELLEEMYPDKTTRPYIVGPDVGYLESEVWLQGFLGNYSNLHAVTYHVYSDVNEKNFNEPAIVDHALADMQWYVPLVHKMAPEAQIWAGEDGPTGGGDDGTCNNGGTESACGLYASSLWCANDLGIRAANSYSQYQRQDLIGGRYGLLSIPHDNEALEAGDSLGIQADFWVNFLWKRLMGSNVHNATISSTSLRLYAHSGVASSPHAVVTAEDATLLIINLGNVSTEILIDGDFRYFEMAPGKGPLGKSTLINGKMMQPYIADGTPILEIPVDAKKSSNSYTIPAYGISFILTSRGFK